MLTHARWGALTAIALIGVLTRQDVALAQATPDPDQLSAAYIEAFDSKDASKLAALFAEDTVLMPPDIPMIRGRAAVEAAYRARFGQLVGRRLQMERLDFETHGDRATAVGTFALVIEHPVANAAAGDIDGRPLLGKYLVVYKRVQNQWLIAFQIMNYDAPQPR